MSKTRWEVTSDGFGIHTFELTKPSITKEEYERILQKNKSRKYYPHYTGGIGIKTFNKGIRVFLNHTSDNFYNIKVIVSAKKLIDEESSPISIMQHNDSFEILHELVNSNLNECLGEGYNMESLSLSRIDLCVNLMLSNTFSAERYVKLIRKSMIYNNNAKIEVFPDSIDRNKHSFRIETGDYSFTAYDKYFQLEDIGESYDKESDALLRLEIAVHRKVIHHNQMESKMNNLQTLYFHTERSKAVFREYIKRYFFKGDYYTVNFMRCAVESSNYSKSQKGKMLSYIDMQQYKHSFHSVIEQMQKNYWTGYRMNKIFFKFDKINVYPISMANRDQHSDRSVPGLWKMLDI